MNIQPPGSDQIGWDLTLAAFVSILTFILVVISKND
jgi:hypothetical protein